MKKYPIGTCGHYGDEKTPANGQTIKTWNVTNELRRCLGDSGVRSISTHNAKRNPLQLLFSAARLGAQCESVIFFLDEKGVQVLLPYMLLLRPLLKARLYYVVIGGWLPLKLRKKRWLLNVIKRLDGVFVETSTLKASINGLGVERVHIMPNFKDLRILGEGELLESGSYPLRLCFFSRVIGQKGIEDLIGAVKAINGESGQTVYELDIYGPVDMRYEERFENIKGDLPPYIRYLGVVDSASSVETLSKYFLHVLPTRFRTEGIPGSVLDSYCAGVPVLASRWDSWEDVIDEGETGITYEFGSCEDLQLKLREAALQPERINAMKPACIRKAAEYRPEENIRILLDAVLGRGRG